MWPWFVLCEWNIMTVYGYLKVKEHHWMDDSQTANPGNMEAMGCFDGDMCFLGALVLCLYIVEEYRSTRSLVETVRQELLSDKYLSI